MKNLLHAFFDTFRKPWLLLLLACFGSLENTAAQDSKGTEFWICVPGNAGSPVPQLYITAEQASTVTVAIPGLGFNQVVNVVAGGLQVVNLPASAQVQTQFAVDNKGIRITATTEVTVYLMNAQQATTDAYLAFPLDAIGMEYYMLGYNRDVSFTQPTQATIVATQNNTTVTITATVTGGGFTAGVPQNITLQQGQVYQLRSLNTNADYSGTKVTANKPVSVFGGAQCTNISGSLRACDHLVEQLPALSSWGRSFVTVPLATRLAGDVFRFMAQTNGTVVSVNGVAVATLNAGQIHERILGSTTYNRITSNQPILVGQYSRSSDADGVTSDPFFALVPPDEQFLNNYTISSGTSNIPINFLNITSPTANIGNVKVDNVVVNPALWNPIPGSSFSGAKVPVSIGVHRVTSVLPVGVLAYGFGSFDSYGYLGGQSFSAVATVTTVTLSPKTGTASVGTERCFEATVKDQFNNPVPGVRVDFAITGANPGSTGFANANASGVARFCYTGTNTGTDNIVASVGSITDAGTFTWTSQPILNVYYSKPAGNLHNVLTWGVNPDGSGANPTDFGAGKTFNLANRAGVYTMTGNWTVLGKLVNPSGSQLQIGNFTLSIADLTGAGTLSGTMMSNLVVTGTTGGNQALNFTGGSNNLGMLTLNRTGSGAMATLGSALNLYGLLNVQAGTFNTGNRLTLKSQANTTARVAPLMGNLTGTATVEQYIPARRAWRMINAPVTGTGGATSGRANMTHAQETVTGTPVTTGGNPRPLASGTATFSLNAARTALQFTATVNNLDVTGSQTPDVNDNLLAAHIHVGALPGSNAPVRWGFFGAPDNDINPKNTTLTPFASGVGGVFSGTWDLPEGNAGTTLATNLPSILAGLAYINFHTVQFGGGEIRGQIFMLGEGTQTIKQAWQENAANSTANPAPGFGTHITGGPIYGSAANGFDVNLNGISETSLKYYDNPAVNWLPVPNTNSTLVGNTPFMLFIRGNRGINLNGPAIPANVTVLRANGNLISGDRVFNVAPNGFTAIPNPYQSPINFATLTRNNVQNLFYVWDPKLGGTNGVGGYVTVSWNGSSYDITPAPISPESQYIQPWQSFLVKSTGAAGTITIKESDKVTNITGNVFRMGGEVTGTSSQQMVRVNLQVQNSDQTWGLVDEILSSFNLGYANRVDEMDVAKMPNFNENLSFIRDGKELTMERRGLLTATDTLYLKLSNTVTGTYRLTFDPVNLTTSFPAFLEDMYQRIAIPISLKKNTQVDFAVTADPASQNPSRFRVVFGSSKMMSSAITLNKLQAEVSPNPIKGSKMNVRLISQPQGVYTVAVVNNLGQTVAQANIQHGGGTALQSVQLGKALSKGLYQVRISNETAAATLTVIAD
ncbi:CHRD domain-containing protein [Flavisolibacter sp. BT320]|nr:CHRD domain-containing protein [Flavisolibacter longurius]